MSERRVVYFDCASGGSGDMLLGAAVDLGLPIERLREELGRLPVSGYRIEASRVTRCGLAATKVDVIAETEGQPHRHLRHVLAILDGVAALYLDRGDELAVVCSARDEKWLLPRAICTDSSSGLVAIISMVSAASAAGVHLHSVELFDVIGSA